MLIINNSIAATGVVHMYDLEPGEVFRFSGETDVFMILDHEDFTVNLCTGALSRTDEGMEERVVEPLKAELNVVKIDW